MKKTIHTCLLYCLILWVFSAVVIAGPLPDTGPARNDDRMEVAVPAPNRRFSGQHAGTLPKHPSYTKLSPGGNPLPDSATTWVMVKDNVTGLIWEVKQHMDGVSHYDDPNDADNTYTWYDSNPDTNGGDAGTAGNGTNTEAFITAMNRAHFGGYSDWRLPTIRELAYLADTSRKDPSINTKYFPNTVSSWFWSSSTSAIYPQHAWGVGFLYGYDSYNYKYIFGYVRAVRGERPGTETAGGMESSLVSHLLP